MIESPSALIDQDFPLCELHRHLDGSVRIQTIIDIAQSSGLELPAWSAEGLKPYVQIDDSEPGLVAFLERFKYLIEILVDEDVCRRVAYENVLDAHAEGIDYIELRFSPWFMAERHGLKAEAVVEACIDGVRAGIRETGIEANLIGILSRTYGPQICAKELAALLAYRDDLVGVDLAGDEQGYPAGLFVEHFKQVRDAGLHVTVHAGEADGPASVWSAINELGAERIGHGFRSIEDPALVVFLAESGIGLECCPTSNLHISALPDYEHHPIKQLSAAGVRFCLNTDDPGISGITLGHEYTVAAPAIGLSEAVIRQSQNDALAMAFISDDEKYRLINKYK